jgi:hypothetical protein
MPNSRAISFQDSSQQTNIDPAAKAFHPVDYYDRHPFPMPPTQIVIAIDVDDLGHDAKLCEQVNRVVAKMAVGAAIDDNPGHGSIVLRPRGDRRQASGVRRQALQSDDRSLISECLIPAA